jgi:hypothetical protein
MNPEHFRAMCGWMLRGRCSTFGRTTWNFERATRERSHGCLSCRVEFGRVLDRPGTGS